MEQTESFRYKWNDIKFNVRKRIQDIQENKEILKGISGEIHGGEMIAILGPSGAGKSSLLDILARRVKSSGATTVTGSSLVNGRRMSNREFRNFSGYVQQMDIFISTLTVRETIEFSANLRLPSSITKEEKSQLVTKTIEALGLSKVADSLIGDEKKKGISGGEKKRVSIGLELVRNPSLLFLDEPTTGLDSTTAYSVISSLRSVTSEKRAVICTLHQPKWSTLQQFDKVMLLSHGHIIYFGPTLDAADYFQKKGFKLNQFQNPADFLLDNIRVNRTGEGENCVTQDQLDKLINDYKELQRADPNDTEEDVSVNSGDASETYTTSWFNQFWYVLQRAFRRALRDPEIAAAELPAYFIVAILMWMIYWNLGNNQQSVNDRTMATFTTILLTSFTPIFAVVSYYPAERPLFNRERASGYYSTSAYYTAVSLSTLPIQLIGAIITVIMSYWAVGFKNDAGSFFFFLFLAIIVVACGDAVGLTLSAIAPSFAIGNIAATINVIFSLYFCGIFQFNTPDWLKWIQWINYLKYGLAAGLINEFEGRTFECDTEPCIIPSATLTLDNETIDIQSLGLECNKGCLFNDYTDHYRFYNLEGLNKWVCLLAVFLLLLLYRVVGYLALRYVKLGKS